MFSLISFAHLLTLYIFSPSYSSNLPQEEKDRVFGKYHRKTVSHSSIDWSIPNDDLSNLLSRSKDDKINSTRIQKLENVDESMTTLSQEMDKAVSTEFSAMPDKYADSTKLPLLHYSQLLS